MRESLEMIWTAAVSWSRVVSVVLWETNHGKFYVYCVDKFFQTNLEDSDIDFGNVLFGNPLLNHLDLTPLRCTLTLGR